MDGGSVEVTSLGEQGSMEHSMHYGVSSWTLFGVTAARILKDRE